MTGEPKYRGTCKRCDGMRQVNAKASEDGELLAAWMETQDWPPERAIAACGVIVCSLGVLLEYERKAPPLVLDDFM